MTQPTEQEIIEAVARGMKKSAQIKSMFKPILTFCDVCQAEFESDLACHGPGVAALDLDCGHRVFFEGKVTSYYKDGKLVLRKEESGHQLPLF